MKDAEGTAAASTLHPIVACEQFEQAVARAVSSSSVAPVRAELLSLVMSWYYLASIGSQQMVSISLRRRATPENGHTGRR